MAAQVSRKQETNVVGDQKNWEQRVTSELEVAKVWCDNWGSLFDGATTQQQQIASLEDKLQRWVRNLCAIDVSRIPKYHSSVQRCCIIIVGVRCSRFVAADKGYQLEQDVNLGLERRRGLISPLCSQSICVRLTLCAPSIRRSGLSRSSKET